MTAFDLVIPTLGRPSLDRLLASLARSAGPRPDRIIVVDDRRERRSALVLAGADDDLRARCCVLAGATRGPAAARNLGWRASRAPWIAFVDDDVEVSERWFEALADDLGGCAADVAGSTGRVAVPLPRDRLPTDWERNVAALENARWITADCAYRRSELLAVGGFDERFPRAFREDADLALRIVAHGKRILPGERNVRHPVRPAPWWISVALQAGNADDVLMSAVHGRAWHASAGAAKGAFRQHVAIAGAAAAAFASTALRRKRSARAAIAAWALLVLRFWWSRFAPGPRTPGEGVALLATSAAIPFAAVFHHLHGRVRVRRWRRAGQHGPLARATAVLFDRDGTLVADVPYNADPGRVAVLPGAREALARLRSAGIATALVSNQSGIALGLVARADVERVNARLEELIGPIGPAFICPHAANDGCTCRKPAAGLIESAARKLGVAPADCVVIGDIGSDVEAAQAAGARSVLVPTSITRSAEIAAAPRCAATIAQAIDDVLAGVV